MTENTENNKKNNILRRLKENPDGFLSFINDVTDSLTIRRLGLILVAAVVATAATLFYDNRNAITVTVIETLVGIQKSSSIQWDVSKETKVEIVKRVNQSQLIKMLMVTQIDLQKNRRTVRYWYLESPKQQEVALKAAALLPQPVFNDDGRNTTQILTVLNADFICSSYSDTIFNTLFPELEEDMPVICRIAIPPIYGHFTGILTIGLDRRPSGHEMTILRQEMTTLATEIYMRDIIKKPSLIVPPYAP